MRPLIRPRPLIAAVFLADRALRVSQTSPAPTTTSRREPAPFLTAVTEDVDAYWTGAFEDAGLAEPRVSYAWLPTGHDGGERLRRRRSATARRRTARPTTPSTSPRTSRAASRTARWTSALPGSSQGYGRRVGDFAVAYIVAHEYGHQIQNELGLFERYGQQLPTRRSSCRPTATPAPGPRAPTRRTSSRTATSRRPSTPRSPSATSTPSNPGHHGTPEQRREAWSAGFETGDPSACSAYLEAA